MDPIKDIVNQVFENLNSNKANKYLELKTVWKNAVGDQASQHTQLSDIQNDVLIINVDSSPWLYQMNIKKRGLLKTIQKKLPEIKNVVFRVRTLTS